MDEPASPPLKLIFRALGVRLRFLIAIALIALLMASWPWLRSTWDYWVVRWIPRTDHQTVSSDTEYFCPMDPGVLSAWPAICPICNMDLITRKRLDAAILPEGVLARMQLSPYRVQLAGVRTEAVQIDPSESPAIFVPASAVVQRDNGPIVYVETMTGMFDALPVVLGEKVDERYVVLSGLKAGQRVVSVGAFLIDAETRLNPSVATQYFGANQHHASSQPPKLAARPLVTAVATLTESEQQLIAKQSICPVTGERLGSMGQPVFVIADGRKVALCCRGCERSFLKQKEKYFALLDAAPAEDKPAAAASSP